MAERNLSVDHVAILLGEQVAVSVFQDRAMSYNEPINVTITKFDGTAATISNTEVDDKPTRHPGRC